MANQDDRDLGFFDQDKVVALMSEPADAMAADGIGAKIVVVGGGALCFVYDRQAITDVDAAIYPKETVARFAAEIARRHGLRPDWLNDNAVGWCPRAWAGPVCAARSALAVLGGRSPKRQSQEKGDQIGRLLVDNCECRRR